jgi:arylformamidase
VGLTVQPDGAHWDQQYNPRLSVANAADYFAAWKQRASEARDRMPAVEFAYGKHARERLDLFRVPAAMGTLVFIHGGYWRAFSKEDLSWIALPFVAAGITVAVLSYPLCPEVRLARISAAIAGAMNYLTRSVLRPNELRRIILAGHSAGAHLAARYQSSSDRTRRARRADAIVCVSGLFDLAPLQHTQMLAGLNFRTTELHAASPLYAPPPPSGEVVLAVGEAEPVEFSWQSERLANAWSARRPPLLRIAGRHHFSVLEALAEPDHALFQYTMRIFD